MTIQNQILIKEIMEKLDLLIRELHEVDIKITFKRRRKRNA